MKYVLFVQSRPEDFEQREQQMPAYRAYSEALSKAGVLTSGHALQAAHASTTVSIKAGQRHVQDGPYADTKEQLGGYFVVDVPNLDEALEWAARCPAASYCAVEIRPMMVLS